MVKEGAKQINLTLTPKTYERITKAWQAKHKDKKIATYCLDTILLKETNDEWLASTYPQLKYMGVSENIMMLNDSDKEKIVGVKLRKGHFWCDTCNENDCGHVYYTVGRLEKALMEDPEPMIVKPKKKSK